MKIIRALTALGLAILIFIALGYNLVNPVTPKSQSQLESLSHPVARSSR